MIRGFWRITLRRWRLLILQPDFAIAVLVGLSMAIMPGDAELEGRFVVVLSAQAGIGAGLLGLVLAGLALLIAFLNAELLEMLRQTGAGLAEDVWPFSFTAMLAALSTAFAVWCLAVVPETSLVPMRIALGVSSGLFIWTLFSVLALVRQVHEYGSLPTRTQ